MRSLFVFIVLGFLFNILLPCTGEEGQGSYVTAGNGVPEVQTSLYLNFTELLKQRFGEGNTAQECPCVVPPGSNSCIVYDSRYVAASVEEAILAFVDVTVDEFDAHPLGRTDYNCVTEECIQCAALIFYRLKEIGFIPQNFQSRFSFPLPALRELHPARCRRFWITRRRTLRGPPTIIPIYVRQLIDAGQKYTADYARYPETSHSQQVSNSLSDSNGPQYQPVIDTQPTPPPNYGVQEVGVPPPQVQPTPSSPIVQPTPPSGIVHPVDYSYYTPAPQSVPLDPLTALLQAKLAFLQSLLGLGRKKRSTPNVSDRNKIIGERFVISCVEKGDAESDETDYLNLCTACWTWRRLPDDYFPPILNELVCQENDFCLSGWGSCTQRYRQVDVLRKTNGKWSPTTVVSGSCCDCKIRAGTEVHQLVIGNTRHPRNQNSESLLTYALRETVDQPTDSMTTFSAGEVNINAPNNQ
ncbi:hypothetical protein FO519_003599 [Halicephalobus sp. NKZ332]|nr:hypothetical protein FO519_003599 [Halicephalobus sp. NKZ332]